ncbi:MAG: hypothetical protein QIT40_gp14 [Lokiarchaeia virus VerdaV4]|uniref:Uncharacterized protein n=1 Tax=Lokiarchaeia virus VerdaV4 TaxID=3070172 RepID=A0AA35CRC6_9CAUD|nr:MAG: hypothetical protein QIT40_gp14 [Lokiarchaeia virus VerdaV4]BDI54972.1 MAG: hypothetical protein [Lokiarchaeia virus VerdaV4]
MSTALTEGYIYFIEAIDEGANDDNWVTTGGGDPDTIDISKWTEGIDYCKIDIPQNIKTGFYTGHNVSDVGSGLQYDLRSAARGYKAFTKGLITSRANAKLMDQFFMSDRHTSGATATYKTYYMIIYFGVNDHWPFTDQNGNQKSYCKGAVLGGDLNWFETKSLTILTNLHWRSIWQ